MLEICPTPLAAANPSCRARLLSALDCIKLSCSTHSWSLRYQGSVSWRGFQRLIARIVCLNSSMAGDLRALRTLMCNTETAQDLMIADASIVHNPGSDGLTLQREHSRGRARKFRPQMLQKQMEAGPGGSRQCAHEASQTSSSCGPGSPC